MEIKTIGKFIIVEIHRPMGIQPDYDFVRVLKDYFDIAKQRNYSVLVKTPNGEKAYDPKLTKKFKIVKEVFLIPDRPMKMYELIIPHTEKKPDDYYVYCSIT